MQTTAIATRQDSPPYTQRTGAPSSYRPEYAEMMVRWFAERGECTLRLLPDSSGAEQARAVCSEVPTFAGFAAHIGVSPQTMDNWCKRHAEFVEARARCKAITEQWFSIALTTGAANPTGAIFVAKNILGWKDRSEVETVSRVEDSESTTAMKAALEHASPAQLADLSALVRAMLANAPAIPSASE